MIFEGHFTAALRFSRGVCDPLEGVKGPGVGWPGPHQAFDQILWLGIQRYTKAWQTLCYNISLELWQGHMSVIKLCAKQQQRNNIMHFFIYKTGKAAYIIIIG